VDEPEEKIKNKAVKNMTTLGLNPPGAFKNFLGTVCSVPADCMMILYLFLEIIY